MKRKIKKKYVFFGGLGALLIGAGLLALGIYRNNDTTIRTITKTDTGSYYSGTAWIVIGAILAFFGAIALIYVLYHVRKAFRER